MKNDVKTKNQCEQACLFIEVLRAVETGVLVLDLAAGRVMFRNGKAVKILSELQAEPGLAGVCKVLACSPEELQQSADDGEGPVRIRHEHRIIGFTAMPLASEQHHIALMLQDLTDRDRLASIDEAAETARNIGDLFSGIRHEIGNPLNSIKMALTVLQSSLKRLSLEETEVYLKRIGGEVARMETLLKSFKNFNMFEKPRLKAIDLAPFINDLLTLLGPSFSQKGIVLEVKLRKGARRIYADARALQQVLMNLLANAVEALAGHSSPLLTIDSRREDGHVLLTLADNGCGMSEELLQEVCKPFYTTKPQGTGLGLALAKKMLSQMNCRLHLESRQGEGTAVILRIPCYAG